MWKDWRVRVMTQIEKWQAPQKWSAYYRMNYLDKDYKQKIPNDLLELITFEKPKRQARIEVYDNWISFDIRELWKDEIYHNVDWNDEEIIERVKLTKFKNLSILWAVSFVMWLWYNFIEDKHYEIEEKKELIQPTLF